MIEVFAEMDTIPVRGNAMASGDPEVDRETETYILDRLDSGDVWAWAYVTVKCTCEDCGAEGSDSLGACTYENTAEFIRAGDYYPDMVAAATKACREECTCYAPDRAEPTHSDVFSCDR